MYGITFNNKHSFRDFGLFVEEKLILPPAKKKTKGSVPGMNGYYDFSTVASNGEIVYDTRSITIKFALISSNREDLYVLYSKILEWLVDVGQSQLVFDFMPDFYFLAEVEEAPSLDEFVDNGDLEVTFICEPFKYGVNEVGNENWDTFNFETDYLQDTDFDINGSGTVTIYNPGRIVSPIINTNVAMTATINGYTTNLNIGDNMDYLFKLQPGINTISINGVGHIKFVFQKEML